MCHQWQANSLFVRFCVQIALKENKIQVAKGKRVTNGLPEWLVLGRIPTNSHLVGEISSDLYRFVQCDIKKCAFDSLKLEQNPQNCD